MSSQWIQAEGRLERAGGARYGYGTHALFHPADRDIRYILRSDALQLRDYEGQDVQVTGVKAEGYPPNEGDPALLDVAAVAPLQG